MYFFEPKCKVNFQIPRLNLMIHFSFENLTHTRFSILSNFIRFSRSLPKADIPDYQKQLSLHTTKRSRF
ncbi:hypothetical protein LEP1GSC125_1216 [Leptospira mayottensis 200901122]|uniref:Uncharacterized protein n=1 Tax=Leptospira mayottensis 200901122 TaxID=1193010 RepID=A0AA87MSS9_9LEPT|nr:hypothetical protein LEP1GSC125_1216 [Leptospira mayottensis 200901122]